ncbi:MAG: SpoIIE family protein phosphatase [Candidatus Riflebacteria bacterium]|nr:SpoIIE family protein phosphatase [Candidatus Riflebacteria bacterium]
MKEIPVKFNTSGLTLLSSPVEEILDGVASLGIYITDLERKVVFWNRAAEEITGYSRDDIVGSSCKDDILCHVDRHGRGLCASEVCPLYRCMVTNDARRLSTFVFAKKKDGTRVPVIISVSPIRDNEGRAIGGMEIFQEAVAEAQQWQLAREVQHRFFPDPALISKLAPIGYDYCPADEIGGDLFSFFPVKNGLVAGVILDVSGHGTASALMVSFIRSTLFEFQQHQIEKPSGVLKYLAERYEAFNVRSHHFTAQAFVYNPSTCDLILSNAGHPLPVIIDANGVPTMLDLGDGGPPIGLFGETEFSDFSVRLKGCRIVFYSDGIIESKSPSGRRIEEEGLRDMCSETYSMKPAAAAKELVKRAFAYAESADPQDDMTAIVLDGVPQ